VERTQAQVQVLGKNCFSNESFKTKTKAIPQPVTTNTNYPMNQSKLENKQIKRGKTRASKS